MVTLVAIIKVPNLVTLDGYPESFQTHLRKSEFQYKQCVHSLRSAKANICGFMRWTDHVNSFCLWDLTMWE